MSANESMDGGCACGEVRYRMESEPLIVHCCHCTRCQRENGASFALNALIEADRVVLTHGEVNEITVASPSGEGQKIARCPKCQIAVWSNYLVIGPPVAENIRFGPRHPLSAYRSQRGRLDRKRARHVRSSTSNSPQVPVAKVRQRVGLS